MSTFKSMMKQRPNLDDLSKKLDEVMGGKKEYKKDERFYYPQLDEKGNGFAIIRFLPTSANDDAPFVTELTHRFQGQRGWFIEKCPKTLGWDHSCAVCDSNDALWQGSKSDQEVARKQKRQKKFISNIYVVKDPVTPDNEGKVFLFRYGPRIMDMLKLAINPNGALDENGDPVEAFDPFDMFNGANFTLRIRRVDNQINYGASKFGSSGNALLGADEKLLEEVWNKEYTLNEIIKEDIKTADEIDTKFRRVTGQVVAPRAVETADAPVVGGSTDIEANDEDDVPFDVLDSSSAVEDDTMEYFKKLIEEG